VTPGAKGAVFAALVLCACGSPPAASNAPAKEGAKPAAPGKASKPFDPCEGSPPVPRVYAGVLREAKCEQEMFLKMASVASQLDVECRFCHVPLVVGGKEDPKKEDYPVMTRKKETANWMSMHLMQAVKPADGSKIQCKSCHVDDRGKPLLKILGNPRNPARAHEWMSLVMVNRFVAADGQKLKCKSCHMGNFGTKDWQAKVILTDHIPAHALPPPGKGPP
jgi:hypothetical protein